MTLAAIKQALEERQYPIPFSGHWIGSEWADDKRAIALSGSINPNSGEQLVHANTSKYLVDQAIDAAYDSSSALQETTLEQRVEYIQRFKQLLVDYRDLIVLALRHEVGKPRWESEQDFASAIRQLDEVLENRDHLVEHLVRPYSFNGSASFSLQPLGVCAVFQTFSAPLNTVVQSIIAGLVSACPLVIMSSSHASLNGMIVAHLLDSLSLPKGAINLVFGNYKGFAKSLQDRRIKGVIYSGSREHCDAIRTDYGGVLGRELMLISGGKNSVIVDKDASIDDAVRTSIWGIVKGAGQLNSSTSRIFIHKDRLGEFGEKIVPVIHNLKIGPSDIMNDNIMGPLYSDKAVEKFLRFQTMAKREAEDTLVWGKAYDTKTKGFFVSPGVHVFAEFDGSSSYQSNVFMCPDVAVYPYDSIEEAIEGANSTSASLVTSLVGDEAKMQGFIKHIKAPNVLLNLPTVGVDVQPLLSGRELCGGHRYNRFGLVALMSYPRACQKSSDYQEILKDWPS